MAYRRLRRRLGRRARRSPSRSRRSASAREAARYPAAAEPRPGSSPSICGKASAASRSKTTSARRSKPRSTRRRRGCARRGRKAGKDQKDVKDLKGEEAPLPCPLSPLVLEVLGVSSRAPGRVKPWKGGRVMTRKSIAVLALSLGLAAFEAALACSCAPPPPPLQVLYDADAVFSARVLKSPKIPRDYTPCGSRSPTPGRERTAGESKIESGLRHLHR